MVRMGLDSLAKVNDGNSSGSPASTVEPARLLTHHQPPSNDDDADLCSDSDPRKSESGLLTNERLGSDDDTHGDLFTQAEERAVLAKLNHLVLFLSLLYLLSFLDRGNIGNARIQGMEEDLDLGPGQYEWLLTGFYITYILFEWMTVMYRFVTLLLPTSLRV